MYRILITEDEGPIAEAIKAAVETWGLDARITSDFSNVTAEFTAYQPHLVLMDITLPYRNGFYWCSKIRKISTVPIVFISSANDNMNIVMAMNLGGDDFICKPFDLSVLTAKINAVLRRTYDFVPQKPVIAHRGLILSTSDSVFIYEGERLELTKNEYRILLSLMEARGSVVSREALMERLWESDSFVDENTLNVNVARLRKKLEASGLNDFVVTRKGLGYIVE